MTVTAPTARPETRTQQYTRLVAAHHAAAAALRANRTPVTVQRMDTASQQLREIQARPVAGCTLPAEAAVLVEDATARGWVVRVLWTPPGHPGEPSVIVQVQRDLAGGGWKFQLSWRFEVGPGWRFDSSRAATPDRPGVHGAPPVKAIRAVIAAHPVLACVAA